MSETFDFYITSVAPVHIGCDEVYEPMGFVIDEEKNRLISFDTLTFFQGMSVDDQNRFATICKKGDIESLLELYKFMRSRTVSGHEVEIAPGITAHYRKTLAISVNDARRIQQELNRFEIARTAFNPNTNQPYIPGSAIKGALRTAWLNKLATRKTIPSPKGKDAARDLEVSLLEGGRFATDPFRLVKVSDFVPAGSVRTKVLYALNTKKKPSEHDARGIPQILEVIQPGSVFVGTINVEAPHPKAQIREPIKAESLFESAVQFYTKQKNQEDAELETINIPPVPFDVGENAFPLRIGRHSGAESITIHGHNRIKIMKGKGEKPAYTNHATTLWLASDESRARNLKSFGWIVVAQGSAPLAKEDNPDNSDRHAGPEITPRDQRIEPSEVEKLLKELDRIKSNDMGRIGTVIQNIDKLSTPEEKAEIAMAIRDKLGKKSFRKHKRREYLESLIRMDE